MAENRLIVLSFDDGPAPVDALGTILTVLQTNAITAEFYLLGNEASEHPDATQLIARHGHKIQNHSWSHANLATADEAVVRSELQRTQKIIKEIAGVTPTRVRPPYGAGGWPTKYDPELAKVAKELSLSINNWDVDTEDWRAPRGIGPKKLESIKTQLAKNKGKGVLNVLMHVQNETARDLSGFIKFLKTLGFKFAAPLG